MIDISIYSLIGVFLLLAIPVALDFYLKLSILRELVYSVIRMIIQLVLIAFFFRYLFAVNNPYFNLLWFMVMVTVAVFSVIRMSKLNKSKILLSSFVSFASTTFLVVVFVNLFVVRIDNIFDARYFIVIAGMLLGNSLRGNIVGIESFYRNIKDNNNRYLYTLSLGAGRIEALLPYLKKSIVLALKPSFSAMATMGIVALPGMMTGAILGGVDPVMAIKYQIMIMIAIISTTIMSVIFTVLLSVKFAFSPYGTLMDDIFVD